MLGSKLDIMNSGWLNLVFANRNQAYGAYQLRQENGRTTGKALAIAVSIFLFVLATPTIANIIRGYIPAAVPKNKVTIVKLDPPPLLEEKKVTPPPVQATQKPQNPMIQSFPPVVRRDDPKQVDPPTEAQLKVADPGPKTMGGGGDSPVIDENPGPVNTPGVTEESPANGIFVAVEVEPTPIGGMDNYYKFLGKKINYPTLAKDNGVQGNVILTFVVEPDGSISNIKSLRDPGSGLADEAIRVMKLAPHWIAGVQNGKKVRVQYTIPVNFKLGDQ